MTTLLLAAALLCPPDASVQQSFVLMRVYKAPGVPVGSAPVVVGTTLSIEVDVNYWEFDGFGQRGYAFSGGRLVVKVNNEPILIRSNAVPLLGPPECGAAPSHRITFDYQVTNFVSSIIAEYSYASCGPGCYSSTVIAWMGLNVGPTSPLTLTASLDTITLSFWGLKSSYEIQASTNLVDWQTVDTVAPENSRVNWTAPIEGARKMYRVKG